MQAVSATEAQRLAALHDYQILDSDPEHDFDDIVHIAAHVCATPIALVSLVDADRQWFKARLGIESCETPINQSVCSLGLCSTDLLIIPDLTTDPRTEDNSLVTHDPALRFYAGAPLVAPGGEVVGMLCVIDTVPRPEGLTDEQRVTLSSLARQVIVLMEYARSLRRREQAELERQLLNEELSHRLKNTLAMVQGIANQTLKDVEDRRAIEAFDSRLLALSSAHDILLQGNWASARIHDVVRGGMTLYGDRFDISGCETMLGPRAALSTAMLLHELATNAMKHGSLSAPEGRVSVRWRVEGEGGEAIFALDWSESGGPPPLEPDHKGFGSKLIALGLAGTRDAQMSYDPSGYRVCFRAPLSRLSQS
jgi:two-component sensor histidine kinase